MMTKEPKIRVIWIDDVRDPNYQLKELAQTERWKLVVPNEFSIEYYKAKFNVEIIWLKTYDEWIDWVVNVWHQEDDDEYINCFCLDHDLGCFDKEGNEKTGLDVAKDIIDELIISGRKLPFYECHSSNPVGRENILSEFESYKKHFLKSEVKK